MVARAAAGDPDPGTTVPSLPGRSPRAPDLPPVGDWPDSV